VYIISPAAMDSDSFPQFYPRQGGHWTVGSRHRNISRTRATIKFSSYFCREGGTYRYLVLFLCYVICRLQKKKAKPLIKQSLQFASLEIPTILSQNLAPFISENVTMRNKNIFCRCCISMVRLQLLENISYHPPPPPPIPKKIMSCKVKDVGEW
jgi:hypothetical protein